MLVRKRSAEGRICGLWGPFHHSITRLTDPAFGGSVSPYHHAYSFRNSSCCWMVFSITLNKRSSRWESPAAHLAARKVAFIRAASVRKNANDSVPLQLSQSPHRTDLRQI